MQLKNDPKTKLKIKEDSKPKKSSVIKNKIKIEADDLILKRKGGGSIIDRRPLFSNDGETLYVIWKHVIRAYSTQTGDFVKEFEPADCKKYTKLMLANGTLPSEMIISIVLSPYDPDTIIGCTDNGELIYWNCKNGVIAKKTKLQIADNSNIKIKTFHIIYYKTYKGKDVYNAVLSSIIKNGDEKILRIELFDLSLGDKTLSKDIENFNEEYYIDIVGNRGENLIVVGQDTFLYIVSPMHGLKYNRQKAGRRITCIAGHPEDECVATGDTSGRVLVWKYITEYNTVRGTYHWHTLPVTEISFSKSGGYMYTGGGECVLVKWLLSNPQNKSFLPRLPAPIAHLTIAPENIYIAISTVDNGITVINPQRKSTAVIQNFTWGVASSPQHLFPSGLNVDPRTNSIVLNSRTGHIQFYNIHTKSLLYNMNITGQNLLTQERDTIIVNTEVIKIAINSDGKWMATLEVRNDNVSYAEVRLKFWQFDLKKQSFILNTSIEFPHEIGVNTVKFRPKSSLGDDDQYAITVGKDSKFKVWQLAELSAEKKTRHWKCYSVGYHGNLSAFDADFSADGSLIGVSFESTLTLWVPETSILKTALSFMCYQLPIIRVEFSKQEFCHLVVTASAEHIGVWDLLSLHLKWSVPINLAILTADPLSVYMAAFTTDNTLVIFTPGNSKPVYIRENVLTKKVAILGACFVPNLHNNNENTIEWQKKSQFFFLDSEQELLALESKSESNVALENLSASRNLPLTAFNRIVAKQKVTSIEKQESFIHDYMRVSGKGIVEELLTVPAHTLPPMRMLCMPFIHSLIGQSSKSKTNVKTTTRNNIKMEEDDSDSDAEDNVKPSQSKFSTMKASLDINKTKTEESNELITLDWSFLSTILPSNVPTN